MLKERFMTLALEQAQRMQGFCAPNPAVGAVIVRDDAVLATGYHRGPGTAHAEVDLFNQVSGSLGNCDLYVTLEPCCHYGRTPPCTDLIIQRKPARVFFASYDPNPQVAGLGQQQLLSAGIVCEYLPVKAIDNFYRPYKNWWQHKRPLVTAKIAITDQHHIAVDSVTGPECQRYTHQQRYCHDAILTTIETILVDDPQLNPRVVDVSVKKPVYVLDSAARLPLEARILKTCASVTLLYANAASLRIQQLEARGVRCIQVPLYKRHRLDLYACLDAIGRDGMQQVWLEAGWTCFGAFLRLGLIDQALFYIASNVSADKRVNPIQFVYECGQSREINWLALPGIENESVILCATYLQGGV